MEIIEHPSHEHVLLLSHEKKREDKVLCDGCDEDCDEGVMIYSCRESDCRFNLHESCAKLPQELRNPLHPHPLSLQYGSYDKCKCNACREYCWGFTFRCDECDVNLDVACAFIRPAAIGEGEEEAVVVGTHPFSHHEHPLLLLQNIPACRIRCRACGGWCSDPKTYGCLPCGFFLHPSCVNLPEEIFHPFHPYHPLTLKCIKGPFALKRIKDDHDVKCNACRKDIYGYKYLGCFAYFCEHCNNRKTSFWLDAECASVIRPAITYEGHDHLLQFNDNMKNIGDEFDDSDEELIKYCSACKSTICEKSYGFRCLDLDCDFNLHLTCGPLPSTIQHQSHIHPLILTNCPIEEEKDCEPDELFCYACEEQRDPFLPIYYCNECHFVAGISCVISEVVSLLKGEHDGDVEMRNPFGQFGNLIHEKQQQRMFKPALTLFDIFNSLSEAEKNELDGAFEKMKIFLPITSGDWECTEIIFKGDGAYTQFMEFLNIGIEIPIEFQDAEEDVQISDFEFYYKLLPQEEVVNIKNYKITRKLAPIFKDLLSKYGDVSARSRLSPKVKLYFFIMLCECIYSMIHTKVVDITTNDLLNWWTSLIISWAGDFRIQFALDHLKRVALTHFCLSAEKQGSKVLEALKEKLEHLTYIKSCLIEKCSRDMLKGWKAGVGLQKASVGLL